MKKLQFTSAVLVVLFTTCFGSPLSAQPILPHLFSDHMVLQRDIDISVWGWGDPGEKISVGIAGNVRETVTGPDGKWRVTLPAARAGGPFVLLVRGQKTIALRDP
jgi:sialate O-acetylesterase